MGEQTTDPETPNGEVRKEPEESSAIHFHGSATVHGNMAARDYYDYSVTTEVSADQLAVLFAPVRQAVQEAPPEKRPEAEAALQAIESELSKGKEADDGVLARLVNSLVDLVPGAVSALATTFASPILAGLTGPVTKMVLDALQRK